MENVFKNWWLLMLKGIILIVLAFAVFNHPIASLVGLTLYIGIALVITGAILIIGSISNRKTNKNWSSSLFEGIFDVVFGAILLSNPGISATVFPFIVGFWMMVYGVLIFSGSFAAKKEGISNWWLFLLGGLLTILLGYFITSNILFGAITITFWIGLGLLIFGIVNISISLTMKKLAK